MTIQLPKPTEYQKKVIDWLGDFYKKGKTACVLSTRLSGKSILCTLLLLKASFEHKGKSVYICPNLIQSLDMFKRIQEWLEGTNLIKATNGMHLSITFFNGSEILFRSCAQGNSLRGLTVLNLLVIDEAAFISADSIAEVLPFISANNASLLVCSTPFLRQGYFYDLYNLGMSGENENVKSFNWSKEPEVSKFLTDERKAFYKKTMPQSKYITEVEGKFLSTDGVLFKNIEDALIDYRPSDDTVYIGIDFGTGSGKDYTAISVINDKDEQVAIYYDNLKSPTLQVDWIAGIINSYKNVVKILAEQNSIGAIYIDHINKKLKRVKLTNWVTSNKSKKDLVSNLQIALEQKKIKLQLDEELVTQLGAYEMEMTKSGTITYNGRAGVHDDCVIATMLSYYALKNSVGTYNVSKNGKRIK